MSEKDPKDDIYKLGLEAASHWGIEVAPVLLASRENIVFKTTLPCSSSAVIRLHRRGYQSAETIKSELWYMDALAHAGLPVPQPILSQSGEMVAELCCGRLASVLSWIDGEAFGQHGMPLETKAGEGSVLLRHRRLGELLARMHHVSDEFKLPAWFVRPDWSADTFLGEAPRWGRFWEHPNLTENQAAKLIHARKFLSRKLDEFGTVSRDHGLIHADVLRENVFASGSDVFLIDFDDSGFGYRLYDLGTALYQNTEEPSYDSIAKALIDGYCSVRPLSPVDLEMIDCFLLLRSLASVGWSMSRLDTIDQRNEDYIRRATKLCDRILPSGENLQTAAIPNAPSAGR